jgi:hypothetical protein
MIIDALRSPRGGCVLACRHVVVATGADRFCSLLSTVDGGDRQTVGGGRAQLSVLDAWWALRSSSTLDACFLLRCQFILSFNGFQDGFRSTLASATFFPLFRRDATNATGGPASPQQHSASPSS